MGKLQAGVFMLRPCAQTTGHMLQLLAQDSRLRFKHDHAEQDFLDWYFKYSRRVLHWPWLCLPRCTPCISESGSPCISESGSARLRGQVLWRPIWYWERHEGPW